MRSPRSNTSSERGSTLIEFAVVAGTLFMMLLGICALSNLYFTHNALVEATRRGARYAATQPAHATCGTPTTGSNSCAACLLRIRNYAIYGNSAGTGTNLLGLQPSNVTVTYVQAPNTASIQTGFGVGTGAVTVKITGYTYHLVIPGVNRQITMPAYSSTASGESAGVLPGGGCATE